MSRINDLINLLETHNVPYGGISERKWNRLTRVYEGEFPAVYYEFMRTMGSYAGKAFLGSSILSDEVLELQEGGTELLRENGLPTVSDKAYVFWMHQGYQMAYFLLDSGNNPDVYYFNEGFDMEGFENVGTLLDFLVKRATVSLDAA